MLNTAQWHKCHVEEMPPKVSLKSSGRHVKSTNPIIWQGCMPSSPQLTTTQSHQMLPQKCVEAQMQCSLWCISCTPKNVQCNCPQSSVIGSKSPPLAVPDKSVLHSQNHSQVRNNFYSFFMGPKTASTASIRSNGCCQLSTSGSDRNATSDRNDPVCEF